MVSTVVIKGERSQLKVGGADICTYADTKKEADIFGTETSAATRASTHQAG